MKSAMYSLEDLRVGVQLEFRSTHSLDDNCASLGGRTQAAADWPIT